MRVPLYLAEQQVPFETLLHPPAFTAQKRAKFLHLSGKQVAKSVLLSGPRGDFLAVLPATHHVNTDQLGAALEGAVSLADADTVAQTFRDCEWGVVAPFGTLYGLATILEDMFDPEALLVFEGPTHGEAIRLRCRDFERLERPRRLTFADQRRLARAGRLPLGG